MRDLGISLPRPPKPISNFAYGVRAGNMLYVSATYGTIVDDAANDILLLRDKVSTEVRLGNAYRSHDSWQSII